MKGGSHVHWEQEISGKDKGKVEFGSQSTGNHYIGSKRRTKNLSERSVKGRCFAHPESKGQDLAANRMGLESSNIKERNKKI